MKKSLPKDAEESNPNYDEKLELDDSSKKSISEQKNDNRLLLAASESLRRDSTEQVSGKSLQKKQGQEI